MMDDLPPSYNSLFNEHRSGLSYIDFLPDGVERGIFRKPKYDKFTSMVDCANQWLRLNPQWQIKTCESIEFKDYNGYINPSEMFYYESNQHRTNYIRGLRLWMKVSPPGEERIQQIGYVNLVPDTETPGGVFTTAKYETLDDLLLKFNSASRTSPLPGRIITIESQEMKVKHGDYIDPDRSSWTEYGKHRVQFIYVIRIFYEIGDPLYEEIGMADFVPDTVSVGCCGLPQYETFSELFQKVSLWCSNQSDLRVCNIQSLSRKVNDGGLDTRKMSYTEYNSMRIIYVRTLRVAYIRQQPLDHRSPVQLSCKTFVPSELKPARLLNLYQPTVENLQTVMQRASNWVQETGAEALNVETSATYLSRKGPVYSSEKSHFHPINNVERYIYVIRVYLKGAFN